MDPAATLPALDFLAPDSDVAGLSALLLERTAEDPLVVEAVAIAQDAHATHVRDEGAPYLVHPLRVTISLERCGARPEVLAAALCHDVFEDAPRHAARVHALGDEVTGLVEALTDDYWDDYIGKVVAGGRDACRVKLADRIDNLRFLHRTSVHKQLRYLRDTAVRFPPVVDRAADDRLGDALRSLLQWHGERIERLG
jgi:guanosine-3',5'-bis(diphosphate) 3'-pyrophosphohydrolase